MTQQTQHVVHISTSISKGCEHCSTFLQGENFAESVNHYLEQHGYSLLHVGQETSNAQNGDLWHSTVAVLGK